MDENDDERAVVVLVRDKPGLQLVPGTWPTEADCGHRAWISPSTRAHFLGRRDEVRYVCTDCAPAQLPRDRDDVELRIIPGSEAEVANTLGHDVAQRLMLHLRAAGFTDDDSRSDGRRDQGST